MSNVEFNAKLCKLIKHKASNDKSDDVHTIKCYINHFMREDPDLNKYLDNIYNSILFRFKYKFDKFIYLLKDTIVNAYAVKEYYKEENDLTPTTFVKLITYQYCDDKCDTINAKFLSLPSRFSECEMIYHAHDDPVKYNEIIKNFSKLEEVTYTKDDMKDGNFVQTIHTMGWDYVIEDDIELSTKDLHKHIPIWDSYNKILFDRYTLESQLKLFKKGSKSYKTINRILDNGLEDGRFIDLYSVVK